VTQKRRHTTHKSKVVHGQYIVGIDGELICDEEHSSGSQGEN